MRMRVAILAMFGFLLAASSAWIALSVFQRGDVRLSVQFLGYTNADWGEHVGVVQVSNACRFVVVRGRSPLVKADSPGGPVVYSYAPSGWSVLKPGECEQVMTEPLTRNRSRWRMTVVGQRLGKDDYGLGAESPAERVVRWVKDHRIPVPHQRPNPRPEFSSEWIEP